MYMPDRSLFTNFVLFFLLRESDAQDGCRILVQPNRTVVAGEVFRFQPIIRSVSNLPVDTSDVIQVWVQLNPLKSGVSLQGQPFANVINGVGQFTDLYVSAPSNGLFLTFNCTFLGLYTASDTFDVQVFGILT